ncbi:hypothetical protein QZH41_020352 [Actinostola sp. cb2023]|nr:hypothetical protein QZH41_020352 [Actinostola sp. cb2023]
MDDDDEKMTLLLVRPEMSFRDVQNLLLLGHDKGLIDDEEFILLFDEYSSRNPNFPYDDYASFDLDEVDEAECLAEFRFRKRDIPVLSDVLQISDTILCDQRSICDGTEGLCMLLKRMSYSCRYGDMIHRFAKPVPVLSMVTNQVLDHIYDTHGHKVLQWNHELLNPVKLQTYVDAITAQEAPLQNCFGFIDRTVRPISRPGENQRIVYNGHKRVHALKFQSIALPNGLIGNLYGPVEGKKHDAGMLADSGLLNNLQQFAFNAAGQPLCVYGDPAYPLRIHLEGPFKNGVLTPQMQAYNAAMSAVRTSVEWLFGDVVNSFKFMDFKKNLKLLLSSVGKMYVVSVILRNDLTCLYGNLTATYFDLAPPTLDEYFN